MVFQRGRSIPHDVMYVAMTTPGTLSKTVPMAKSWAAAALGLAAAASWLVRSCRAQLAGPLDSDKASWRRGLGVVYPNGLGKEIFKDETVCVCSCLLAVCSILIFARRDRAAHTHAQHALDWPECGLNVCKKWADKGCWDMDNGEACDPILEQCKRSFCSPMCTMATWALVGDGTGPVYLADKAACKVSDRAAA